MSAYDDIKYLQHHSIWPNGKTPEWAERRSIALGVSSTNAIVHVDGLMDEIETLRLEIVFLKEKLK